MYQGPCRQTPSTWDKSVSGTQGAVMTTPPPLVEHHPLGRQGARRFTRGRWLSIAAFSGLLTVASACGSNPDVGAPEPSTPACMAYNNFLDIAPGTVKPFDVHVAVGDCADQIVRKAQESVLNNDSPERDALDQALRQGRITEAQYEQKRNEFQVKEESEADAAVTSAKNVMVGSKVKISLTAPLFDGSIAPVTTDVQTFDTTHRAGRWEWQIKPNTPGNYSLPLTLTVFDKDGKDVLTEGEILQVYVHVPETPEYVGSSMWTGVLNFFTSLQGLVASIAAILAGTAGLRAWAGRRSKKKKKEDAPVVKDRDGYL